MPLLLVRHASAGSRSEWEGDDPERPLDDRGIEQAREIVARLADLPVARILTSPAVRCVETVQPLAAARGLELELRGELSEERHAVEGAALIRELAGSDVVLCGHGGLQTALSDPPRWKKGSTFVVGTDLTVLEVREP